MSKFIQLRERRQRRARHKIRLRAGGRPRLSVYRAHENIHAQIIDDEQGRTIAAASTLDKDVRATLGKGGNVAAAVAVGKLIAERAKAAGIEEVVFDRGGYIYHGRVKALADAAREAGLKF